MGGGQGVRRHAGAQRRRPGGHQCPHHHRERSPVGKPLDVGIVGLGNISAQYMTTLADLPQLRLVAVADLAHHRAEEVAAARGGVQALDVDQLIAHPAVDVVLNLTVPAAHAEIALQAIAAGKDVYGEKPLAATTAEGTKVVEAALAAGVRVGCAPDTVLGTGTQTARRAIDDGVIGRPVAATATMTTPGHEAWHPNPDFYYQPGGGPLLDMGPYYVTALVTLLGPVADVVGAASHTRASRVIGRGPRAGESIPVAVDSHVTGILRHASGALSTLVMSFDGAKTRAAPIEVHGEEASLTVPDPNQFDGDVLIHRPAHDWELLPPSAGYLDGGRGIGLADLALTPTGREPRANATLALHVLDVMESILRSAEQGAWAAVGTTAERPAPVPLSALTG
nr:Gfo/Idh/MocA family oxidoreductase [Phytoactinopolyspora alkaliphila]